MHARRIPAGVGTGKGERMTSRVEKWVVMDHCRRKRAESAVYLANRGC